MDEFIDTISWYWIAGYAGDLFTIVVILFLALTIYGYHIGGDDEDRN